MSSPALTAMALRAEDRLHSVTYWRGVRRSAEARLDEMQHDPSTGPDEYLDVASALETAQYELHRLGWE